MKPLYKKANEDILLTQELQIADNTWKRLKGLLGTKELNKDQMIWIHMCNSIHTFFMQYPIDCLFLDEHLVIRSIKKDIHPWRATFPVIRAISVIEMRSGRASELGLKEGDQLYVGT
jgi:uncharacterized membrane protein (UPF0127 family)